MSSGRCVSNIQAKRLYSIKDLAELIGATDWFWRTQIWNGDLPYVQVGKKMFVDYQDIEEFIQKNKFRN